MPVYPGAPPVPAATFRTFHAPYAGRFLGVALPGSSPLPWPSPGLPRARLLLVRPKAGTNDAAGFASCCGPLSCSPRRAFDAGLRPGPSPDRAASLLPGLLAATRTGLTPAGDDERVGSGHLTAPPPTLGARRRARRPAAETPSRWSGSRTA